MVTALRVKNPMLFVTLKRSTSTKRRSRAAILAGPNSVDPAMESSIMLGFWRVTTAPPVDVTRTDDGCSSGSNRCGLTGFQL